jgi:hypothetical protein
MGEGEEDDFDILMRRHRIEVLPEARDAARRVFDELTQAALTLRGPREMTAEIGYTIAAGGEPK